MWIVCCRKQQDTAADTTITTTKGNKSKDKSKHRKQKYSRGRNSDKTDLENSNNNNNKNNNNENNDTGSSNIDTKLRKDSHDSTINGCYPRQERRSLPDVVIPSTHLIPCSNAFPSNQRPSLHIDYETGRRPTIMVETTAKLAESESTGLDDHYSSSLFNKTFLTNDLKAKNEQTDSLLNKRRAHSLIPTYCEKDLQETGKIRQSRKSEVVRSVDDGKKTPFKKRLSLLKVKPLKRFRKSKENILSVDVQKPYNTEEGKTNLLLTTTPDTRFVFKAKSSFRRIKHSKLFSPAKSSHENILISKDTNTTSISNNNNNESFSERSEDSLGQLPTPRNSMLKRISPRGADAAYTDPRKRNFLDNIQHNPNSRNAVLRRGSLCIFSQVDEPIVTPFAQILASLRKVRTNFILLTNVTSTRDSRFGAVQPMQAIEDGNNSSSYSELKIGSSGQAKVTATETLEELEWCLERLENIQTHRSVSDMASSKFKKMLNKELSQFADGGQSGKQISEYIFSTFLDSKENDPLNSPSSMITTTPHSSGGNNTHGVCNNNNNSNNSEMTTCSSSPATKKLDSSGIHIATRPIELDHVIPAVTTLPHSTTTNISDGHITNNSLSTSMGTMSGSTSVVNSASSPSTAVSPLASLSVASSGIDEIRSSGGDDKSTGKYQLHTSESNNNPSIFVPTPSPSVHFHNQHNQHQHQHHHYHHEHSSENNLPTSIVPYIMNSKNPARLEELLQNSLDLWGIDIFEIDQLTTHPLTCIFFNIVQKRNLLQRFSIPERNLILYMNAVEAKYNDNPYHNCIHAADVVQSTHILLNAQSLESVFTDLEIFTVLFACAIHDVGHPGVTNQYLINTNDKLAILYNDSSVLENHHLAIAFSLLGQPGHDVFENFPRKQRLSSRRMIIDMVLATDMSKHMSLLADLKTMVETKKVAGSSILTLESYIDRMQILQNMVHCADLSNPAKPLDLYRQWTGRVMEELFRQGDKERELGIDISPICDRNTATIEKSQVSFIDYIVHPLWETWSDLVYPDAQNILETLEDNREWYFSQINETNNSDMDNNDNDDHDDDNNNNNDKNNSNTTATENEE